MEEMHKEILQLQCKLVEFERGKHREISYSHNSDPLKRVEEENLFHQEIFNEEELIPCLFDIEYRRIYHDIRVQIDLLEFKSRVDLDGFIE